MFLPASVGQVGVPTEDLQVQPGGEVARLAGLGDSLLGPVAWAAGEVNEVGEEGFFVGLKPYLPRFGSRASRVVVVSPVFNTPHSVRKPPLPLRSSGRLKNRRDLRVSAGRRIPETERSAFRLRGAGGASGRPGRRDWRLPEQARKCAFQVSGVGSCFGRLGRCSIAWRLKPRGPRFGSGAN